MTVPKVWLTRAHFSHAPHRAVDCRACHEQAYGNAKDDTGEHGSWLDNQKVMIANIDVCVACHAQRTAQDTAGARTDCVECHRYHAADRPPQGLELRSVRPADRRTLPDFLRGTLVPRDTTNPRDTTQVRP